MIGGEGWFCFMAEAHSPKVSIITACYNNAKTIETTILSVLSQSYKNIEYIIVDANSNDGSFEIIAQYESKIDLWIREGDQGIADAWNKGIEAASGEIIGFINADDYYSPDAVEEAVIALFRAPQFGFVFGDLAVVDQQGNVQCYLKGDPQYKDQIVFSMPSIPHPTVFVRKSIYNQCGGFDLRYKTALDYEFLLRIYKMGVNGKYIDRKMVTMMSGGESDINFVRAHREVADITIRYGYSSVLAYVRMYCKIITSSVRKVFERNGMTNITAWYRRLVHNQYKY